MSWKHTFRASLLHVCFKGSLNQTLKKQQHEQAAALGEWPSLPPEGESGGPAPELLP